MLSLELRFRSGRFHATPWGRHVNEAIAEWPPSPYRLVRALYDVWQRKLPGWTAERVEPLLEKLASEPPRFWLPAAGASHTRSYLHNNTFDPTDKSLVFDGFVALHPETPVTMTWPAVELTGGESRDLAEMLSLLNFFGRSESWIEAGMGVQGGEWNCEPATVSVRDGELVRVTCVTPSPAYRTERRKGAPESWLQALTYSTTQMIRDRASHPPAMRVVPYVRKMGALEAPPARRACGEAVPVTAVLYALSGKLLPRVESTIEVAEQVRIRLMGIHKRRVKDPSRVSPKFSGHDAAGGPLKEHRHCYILPQSLNGRHGSRYIDHILVWCRDPFDTSELLALHRLTTLWQADGKPDVRCVLVSSGSSDALRTATRIARSVTPFVPPRHYRSGRGDYLEWLEAEIRRECVNHGLGLPQITPIAGDWRAFRRNRKGELPRRGFGFGLEFAKPIQAPFSIGYGCHLGLGQFRA